MSIEMEIGTAAVKMQRAKNIIRKWIREQESEGHGAQLQEAPTWKEYEKLQNDYLILLESVV